MAAGTERVGGELDLTAIIAASDPYPERRSPGYCWRSWPPRHTGECGCEAAGRASDLQFGQGSSLWRYWTKGGGLAKWSGAVHKWTTLRDLLLAAGVPGHSADGLATNIIMAVMPGYMKLAHAKGRSGMDGAGSERFNPNHVPGGAGGGQFTSGSGGGGKPKAAPAAKAPAKAPAGKPKAAGKAHPALPSTPNGLGYSAAQWKQLQQWEADYKAGKKLDHHQLHMLHEAHLKHVAALGRKAAAGGPDAARLHAQREAHKAHAARLAREAAAAKAGAHKAGRSVIDAISEYERAAKPYGDVAYADPKNGKYPIDTADHAKAAWDYISQPENAAKYPMNGVSLAEVKDRIMAACKKFGITISDSDGDEANSAEPGGEDRSAGDGWCVRSVPFELTGDGGDGLTLEGYAAVFNRTARITDRAGEFDERIAPGAFADSIARRKPVLMFEHGKHPLIGSMPLGRIDDIREDGKGLFISARLSDNWLIQPVRDAVRDGAVNGMSFRFHSPADEDQRWEKRAGQPDLRTLLRLDPPELGPVVFPAYTPTTASVRSLLDELGEDFTGRVAARSGPGREHDVQPGHGRTSPTTTAALRDRAWRMREVR